MRVARLDRYVAGALLGSYLSTLFFLIAMFTVFDLVYRLDTYLEAAAGGGLSPGETLLRILQYEALAVPVMFVRVAPFVTVIASMFALARLMAANEIVPMLFTGRSAVRILCPMLLLGLVSAAAMGATWEWVLPRVREDYEGVRLFLRGRGGPQTLEGISIRAPGDPRVELFCQTYQVDQEVLEGVVLFDRTGSGGVGTYTGAASAAWDAASQDWRLVEGHRIVSIGASTEMRDQDFLGVPGITPHLVVQSEREKKGTSNLSYSELLELMAMRADRTDYRLAFHSHITAPLSNLVLLMLALPFGMRFERGRRIEYVLLAMLLCAFHLLMDITCQNLVYRGSLGPVVGAWSPTLVSGSLAAVLFGSMRS